MLQERRIRTDRQRISSDRSPQLREYFDVVRVYKWSILFFAIGFLGLSLYVSYQQTPVYESEVGVLVETLSTQGDRNNQVNLDTEVELLGSVPVAELVIKGLELKVSTDTLRNDLAVSAIGNTEILQLAYRHPDRREAQRRAQAFADAYLDYRRQRDIENITAESTRIEAELTVLNDRLNQVNSELATADEKKRPALQSQATLLLGLIIERQLGQLGLTQALSVGRVVEPATIPTSPASPNHLINGAFGLGAGLFLGVASAFMRTRLSGRLGTTHEVEAFLGAPVLAVIPHVSQWKRRNESFLVTRSDRQSAAAEAYRLLRTNLLSASKASSIKTLLVTSAQTREGKSATAANLAVVVAESGKRVALVSADLRKPTLNKFFNAPNRLGLTDVLLRRVELGEAMTFVGPNLRLLTSGSANASPGELLGSPEMGRLLNELESLADVIIIDSPPVLPVTDAITIASMDNAVLFVVGPGSTVQATLASSREHLEKVGANIVGAVLNNFDSPLARAYSAVS